jgi:Fur family transcriptional regulator, ferric uptake regulator
MHMRSSSVDSAILDALAQADTHLSSQQIYDRICDRLPAVNPSTVYRSLERLTQQGKVSISDMGTGTAVFELVREGMHHHLVCQRCSKVITLPDEIIRQFFEQLETGQQFRVMTNHLVLFGLCQDCLDQDSASPSH